MSRLVPITPWLLQLGDQHYTYMFNLVPRAFCFRGWMVSEKGPGIGWSVLQPDWSMILNIIIQYTGEIIIILVKREWSDKFIISS